MCAATPTVVPAVGTVALRLWRIFFVIAFVVVTVSTHWPRLPINQPTFPVDKFLHASAFGILTAMLWQTRWMSSRLWCVLAVALWSAIDESTQALPGIDRSADLDDWCANILGVLIAGMFMAATRPVPGAMAKLINARRRILALMLLDRPMNWFHLGTATVLGIGVGATCGFMLDANYSSIVSRPAQAIVLGGILGGLAAFYMMREFGVRTLQRRVEAQRPCLHCGAPTAGASTCANCGSAVHPLAWDRFATLSGREEFFICAPTMLLAFVLFLLVAAAVIFIPTFFSSVDFMRQLSKWYGTWRTDMQRVLDIAFISVAGTWALYSCRRRLARAVDRSGQRCLACGHDLRGLKEDVANGICTECGEPFVRSSAVA